ncbi:MAG: ribosome silencing factor [Candidatus Omnitrophota bacterium]
MKRQEKIDSKEKSILATRFAKDKKAEEITVLDMRKTSNFCDFFVIMSSASTRQSKAIADAIEKGLGSKKVRLLHCEGKSEGLWILQDYGDVIVHIFNQDIRSFYCLERLWSDAQRLDF